MDASSIAHRATERLALSGEQAQLRAAVRRFLDELCSEEEVRRLADGDTGYEPAVWARLAHELGLPGLLIPESFGGSGGTFADLCIVMEEMGRSLACLPFFSTSVVAVNALLEAGGPLAAELLGSIAAGEGLVTLAITEDDGGWGEAHVRAGARLSTDGHRLTGAKAFVVDGLVAGTLLVAARAADGVGLFSVDANGPGVERRAQASLDPTRKLARITFTDAPAQLVGPADGWPAVSRALGRASVALAAEQVGGARQALETMVAYAKVRVQFGKPIGSFQAIRHRCADAMLAVESAASIVQLAALAVDDDDPNVLALANATKAFASETYVNVALENIQLHGGMGFTWEHSAHLHYKRARSSALLLGDPTQHRRRLADRVGL